MFLASRCKLHLEVKGCYSAGRDFGTDDAQQA
jgi:hypothetical protein